MANLSSRSGEKLFTSGYSDRVRWELSACGLVRATYSPFISVRWETVPSGYSDKVRWELSACGLVRATYSDIQFQSYHYCSLLFYVQLSHEVCFGVKFYYCFSINVVVVPYCTCWVLYTHPCVFIRFSGTKMRHAWDMGVAPQHPSTSHNFIYLVNTNVFINSRGMLVYYSILLVVLFWSGNLLLSLEQHVCFFKYIMLMFIV